LDEAKEMNISKVKCTFGIYVKELLVNADDADHAIDHCTLYGASHGESGPSDQ